MYRLRTKYRDVIERKDPKSIKRRQFNMMVADDIVLAVKLLAATLKVPR